MTYPLEIVELSAQKPTRTRKCEVSIEKEYLLYYIDFDATNLINTEDPMLGWTDDERSYLEVYVKKSMISVIEKIWNDSQEKWQINIITTGGPDLKLFFDYRNEEGADDIKQKILDWWLV